jgi:formylglycine-generating enzyme required for sulfatase activity
MYLIVVIVMLTCVSFSKNQEVESPSKYDEMVEIPGDTFSMGSDDLKGRDGESPSKLVRVKSFKINKYPVTNEQFRKFVRETKYKTEAENFAWSFALAPRVDPEIRKGIKEAVPGAPWWIPVQKAYWRQPEGPGSSIKDRMNYPALHMSWNDATKYCEWAGKRLPTEPEWELAARGGLKGKEYPWGSKFEKSRMNIWQGKFPDENTKEDGYLGPAPVDAYKPQNKFGNIHLDAKEPKHANCLCSAKGLHDMVGNVWEWVSTEYKETDGRPSSEKKYVLRGGSYLDSEDGSFNHLARVTTR